MAEVYGLDDEMPDSLLEQGDEQVPEPAEDEDGGAGEPEP